jgi:hypothetical protein
MLLSETKNSSLKPSNALMIPNYKKNYQDKLLNTFDKPESPQPIQSHSLLPSTSTNTYDLTIILDKKIIQTSSHNPRITI